jgi:hypothetical protein
MLLSMKEAKRRWCPMVRMDAGTQSTQNRGAQGELIYPSNCVADECMMWRWSKSDQSGVGYCGLAGRPGGSP